jgi:AcrR family transcriptional regulator
MKTEKHNRQAQRTRRALSDALIALILEKHYDGISVQDIIERADVGRSTFYAHYRDKEDLLFAEFDRLIDALSQQAVAHDLHGDSLFPGLGLLRHVQEQYELYKALVRGRGAELFMAYAQKVIGAQIEQRLASSLHDGHEPAVPPAIMSNFLTGAFLRLLKWWLDGKMPCSPERLDEMYWQMAAPAIDAALSSSALSPAANASQHHSTGGGASG